MAKTNLNVSPYFDDFDATKNFYKVLFKPGYPVQARELTTLQSILQDQISSLGKSIFKDGSVVIPGEVSYDPNYYAVKINPIHLGLDVEFYYKELIGKRLFGDFSQITAVVQNVVSRNNSIENVTTLYVKYLNSNSNNENLSFIDGETLTTLDNVKYGNTTITSGNTVASLSDTNSTAIGSAVSISPGIYFIRGLFVTVDQDTIILDQYNNSPSYRVGLSVSETFISSYDDPSLYDSAKGFTNYSAPGADRFRLKTKLSKQLLTDYEDTNFIEILRITDGVVRKIKDTSDNFFTQNQTMFDFIYVDGNHKFDYVLRDCSNAWKFLNKNGFLVCDDYIWDYYKELLENPCYAINEFIKKNNKEVKILLVTNSQIFIQKI